MKRYFLTIAIVLMSTLNKKVIYDLERGFTYYNSTDILVFTYSARGDENESSVEVTESSGYSEHERTPGQATEDRTEAFTLSPEMEEVLDYWNQFSTNNRP